MSQGNQLPAAAPIFLLSCERSGSTLLRYIIDTHPHASNPAHLHLGQLCSSLYKTAYYSIGQTVTVEDEIARERLVAAEVRRIVDDLMGRYAMAKGKRVWCEKTTENLQHLKVLTDAFPDARYICLYRNCMDVAQSTMECVRLGVMPELAPYVQKNPRNMVAAVVNNWIEKTTTLLEFELAYVSQCFRVKYESLVLHPTETLRAMFAALDLEWDEKLLSAIFSTEHDQGPGDKKILFTKRISADSIGRGSTLSREQIPTALLDKTNELLVRLDYPIVDPDWDFSPSPYLPAESKAKTAAAIRGVEEVFDNYIPQRLKKQRAGLQGIEGSCKFDVSDGGGTWLLTVRGSEGLLEATERDADCSVRISAGDLLDVVNGRENVIAAFAQGKIRLAGDYALANRLAQVLFG